MAYPNPVGVCETEKVKEGFGCMTSLGKETFPQSSHKACCQKVDSERKKRNLTHQMKKSTFLISVHSHSQKGISNQIFTVKENDGRHERIAEKMLSCLFIPQTDVWSLYMFMLVYGSAKLARMINYVHFTNS